MTYTLKQVAQACGVSERAVKHWEGRGLLGLVERESERQRVYTEDQMQRAKFIAAAQIAGWDLARISKTMLNYEVLRTALLRRAGQIKAALKELPAEREWDL